MEFNEAWDDTCSSIGIAARHGRLDILRQLIENGNSVDAADNRGWRPLHEAAAVPTDLECLEELLKHDKTDANWMTHEGETALLLACKRRSGSNADEAVQLLLHYGADPNIVDNEAETPLLVAVRNGNTVAVERLINSGYAETNLGDSSGWRPLHEAATNGHFEMLTCLLNANTCIDVQDECGMTPIFTAAQHGQENCLSELLRVAKNRGQLKVMNIGAEDWATPLMITAQQGFTNCVKILLDYGANPNLLTTDNATALHLAVQGDHVDCLNLLLSKMDVQPLLNATHPSIVNTPQHIGIEIISPLHLAVEWHSYKCLRRLLQAGFSADSVYERCALPVDEWSPLALPRHETALSYAVHKEDKESMVILLQAGATCNTPSDLIFHPLMRALFNDSLEELNLLLEHGSNINYHRQWVPSNEILLVALTNREYLEWLLKCGCDPHLCFNSGTDLALQLFVECTLWDRNHKNAVSSLELMLQFLVVNEAVRNAFNAVANKAREQSMYNEESWRNVLHQVDQPTCLKQMCRIKIRQHLTSVHGSRFRTFVNYLSLPHLLEQYVLFNSSQ